MQNVYPGQRVVTKYGTTVTVAIVKYGRVWAFTSQGLQPVVVKHDAWGGEHDMEVMNAA